MVNTGSDLPAPQPVPELVLGLVVGAPPPVGVTDEERNRYGVLLDHAAERGLLSSVEYQARLSDLADAASVEELQRIVTELPAFGAIGAGAPPQPGPRRSSGRPWLVLAAVLVLLLVAVVVLALVAAHVVHARHAAWAGSGVAVLSRLRL